MMKSLLLVVFAICIHQYVVQATGNNFSPWSEFGKCGCNKIQTRSRNSFCNGRYCDIETQVDSQECVCVPLTVTDECTMVVGAQSLYGILEDPCDCNGYIQCVFNFTSNTLYGIHRDCKPCTTWNQDLLTCIRDRNDLDCIHLPFIPLLSYVNFTCTLQAVEGFPAKFRNGEQELDCAPGTQFNATSCKCDTLVDYFGGDDREITCLTFDKGINASQGIYVHSNNVKYINDTEKCKSGNCIYFNSTLKATLEIPCFSNALDMDDSFTVSFFFKRLTSSGNRILLDNSNCDSQASISVYTSPFEIITVLMNSTKARAVSTAVVYTHENAEFYHHFVISYDGTTITTYLDNNIAYRIELGGKIDRVKAPIVIGGSTCGDEEFYEGYIDTMVFFKTPLTHAQVRTLNNNPNLCNPN